MGESATHQGYVRIAQSQLDRIAFEAFDLLDETRPPGGTFRSAWDELWRGLLELQDDLDTLASEGPGSWAERFHETERRMEEAQDRLRKARELAGQAATADARGASPRDERAAGRFHRGLARAAAWVLPRR